MLQGPIDSIILAESEIVRSSWWELELNSPTGRMPTAFQYRIREVPSLGDGVEAVAYTPINSQVLYPGQKRAAGSLDLKLHLYDKDELYKFFEDWHKLVHDEDTDAIGVYDDVVGQGVLKLYSAGNTDPVLSKTVKLIDCWPNSITLGAATRESEGDPFGYTVTLQVTAVSTE